VFEFCYDFKRALQKDMYWKSWKWVKDSLMISFKNEKMNKIVAKS